MQVYDKIVGNSITLRKKISKILIMAPNMYLKKMLIKNIFELITFYSLVSTAFACISSPNAALKMQLSNKIASTGSDLNVSLYIDSPTPDFKAVLTVGNGKPVETFFYELKAAWNQTISYRTVDTGWSDVQLQIHWLGKPFVLKDRVYVYKPIRERNVSLNASDIVTLPTGNVALYLELTDQNELPTNVSGELDWGDESLEKISLEKATQPGNTGNLSVIFTHTYEETRDFEVRAMLGNKVSKVIKSKKVRVLKKLEIGKVNIKYSTDKAKNITEFTESPEKVTEIPDNISDTLEKVSEDFENNRKNKNIFLSNEFLEFSCEILSGDVDKFYLEVDGKNISSSILPILYRFEKAGSYNSKMWAEGLAGLSNKEEIEVEIRNPILGEKILVQAPRIVVVPPGVAEVVIAIQDFTLSLSNIYGFIKWEENTTHEFSWKNDKNNEIDSCYVEEFSRYSENSKFDSSRKNRDDRLLDTTDSKSSTRVSSVSGSSTQSKRMFCNHVYENAAIYEIEIYLSNYVSEISKFETFTVIKDVIISTMKMSTENSTFGVVFPTHKVVLFEFKVDNGEVDLYHLKVDEIEVKSEELPLNFTFTNPGEYGATVWASKLGINSNFISKKVGIQNILEEKYVKISTNAFSVATQTPALIDITISKSDENELPTNVSTKIQWNENNTYEFNFFDENVTGFRKNSTNSMENLMKSLIFVYEDFGNFEVEIVLENNVSRVSEILQITVIPPLKIEELYINNIVLNKTSDSNVFPSRRILAFSTDILSGEPDEFFLQIDEEEILNSTDLPIKFKFPKSGVFVIKIWATGQAGKSNTVEAVVDIQKEIFSKNVEVIGFPEQPIGYLGRVSFSMRLKDHYDATNDVRLTIDWGDSKMTKSRLFAPDEVNESETKNYFEHVYHTGKFVLNMMVENEVSELTTFYLVTVVPKIEFQEILISYSTENSTVQHLETSTEKAVLVTKANKNFPEISMEETSSDLSKYQSEKNFFKTEHKPYETNHCSKAFPRGFILSFGLVNFSGYVLLWSLQVENETVSSVETINEMNHVFDEVGWYNITLTAKGLDNDTYSKSRKIFIGQQIKFLGAWINPKTSTAGAELVLSIRTTWVEGSCLTINFGDKTLDENFCDPLFCTERDYKFLQLRPKSNDLILKHFYNSPGTYKISVEIDGPLNNISKTLKIKTDENSFCRGIEARIENSTSRDNALQINRKDKIILKSELLLEDCVISNFKWKVVWSLKKVDEDFENFLPAILENSENKVKSDSKNQQKSSKNLQNGIRNEQELLKDVDLKSSNLFIKGNVLKYGFYYFSVKFVVIVPDNNSKDQEPKEISTVIDTTVVEITKSDLVAKVFEETVTYISRGNTQSINLCASCFSFDPDQVFSIVKYSWWCKRAEEKWTDGNLQKLPTFRRDFDRREDSGGCWGDGPGKLDFTDGHLVFNSSMFLIWPENYHIKFEVESEDGRRSSSILELEIVDGTPPVLSSACIPIESCTFYDGVAFVNPNKLILATSCIQEEDNFSDSSDLGDDRCGQPPVRYEWNMYGINNGAEPIKIDLTGYATGADRYRFALQDIFWTSKHNVYDKYKILVLGKREGEAPKGKTMLNLKVNYPPHEGKCSMVENYENIKALIQEVKVICEGWKDPENRGVGHYKASVIYESGTKNPLWSGTKFPAILYLPFGVFDLIVEIFDIQEAVTLVSLAQISTILPSIEEYEDYIARDEVGAALERKDVSTVNMLLNAEKSVKSNNLSSSSADDSAKNGNLVNAVDSFPVNNMDDILQATSVLSAVAYPLPKKNQEAAIASLKKLSEGSASGGSSPQLQKEFASASIGTVSSLLQGVNEKKEEDDDNENEDFERNKKVESMMGVVENSQKSILNTAVVGEATAVVRSVGTVAMGVGFFDASELDGKMLELDGATYVFPHYCHLMAKEDSCIENKSVSIGIKMANWINPVFNFGGGREMLSDESSTVQLSIVDNSMNPIPITQSTSDIIIYVPRKPDVPEPEFVDPAMLEGQRFMSHAINFPQPRLGFNLYFKPSVENETEDWIITWSAVTPFNTSNLTIYALNDLKYHEDLNMYGLFLSSEEVGEETGLRYVGIGKRNRTKPCINSETVYVDYINEVTICLDEETTLETQNLYDDMTDADVPNLQESYNESYSLLTFVSSCLFYDPHNLSWSSEGCKVIGANLSVTICACNHLTSFGSGLIVAPNPIDFSYVFANANFSQNLTIYLTLIFMLVFSVTGMIFARFMDIQDKKKVGATPLPNNHPEDKYLYDIMIHTGFYPDSGTLSNVNFLLSGDFDDTGVRELRDSHRRILSRGGHDQFVMATQRCLGSLQYLRIWHDNSGPGSKASWFFSHMIVRDIQTGDEFQFISNQWLAVEEGDGRIERGVSVANEVEKRDFGHVFGKTVEKNLSDDHLWLSVVLRPPRSRFTRVQRLASVIALLFLSMLVNAMFFERVPDSPGQGGLNVGPFSLSPEAMSVGLMSNLIVFPPSFLIILLFRKSKLRKLRPSRIKEALKKQKGGKYEVSEDEKSENSSENSQRTENTRSLSMDSDKIRKLEVKRKKKFQFPWWGRIIAWLLVAACVLTSLFFLWAYGIMFGDEKVQKWLSALVVSVVSSMFVAQPVKIYLMAAVLSFILKKPLNENEDYDEDEELMEIEYDEQYLHDNELDTSRRKKEYTGCPINEEELKNARIKREKEVAMNSLIIEIVLYLIFLSVILAISYGSRNPSIIYMKNHYMDLFASSGSKCPTFLKIKKTSDVWCWARETFVPAILEDELYNGRNVNDPAMKEIFESTISDRVATLVGFAVFRQIRVQPDNCIMHPHMRNYFNECNGFSDFTNEQSRDFGKGWNTSADKMDQNYKFRSPFSVQGIPYSGILDTYGGGGYIVELRNKKKKALKQVNMLEKHGWIDKYTRAFFAEVALYNAQVNLFGVIMCVAEFIPGGGIHSSFKFYGLNLYRYHSGAGIFMLVSELAFVIFTVFFIRREHKVWKKEGKTYFKSVWNLMEILTIFLAITTIVFYTIKTLYSIYLMDKLTRSKGRKYIRMQSLAVFDETLTFIIGFLLFIATIKLLKLLRFNKKIGFLSQTLNAASSDILGFGILFVVTLMSFVSIFHLTSVTSTVEFSTFIKSAETCIFEITQKFKEISEVSPTMGPLFFFVFAFIMNWVVLQVLIAIICHTFTRIKNDLNSQPNDYEVVDYLIEKLVRYLGVFNKKKAKVEHGNDTKSNLNKIESSLDVITRKLDNLEKRLDVTE